MNCVVCAVRGRTRELETGHVCPACAVHLADTLTDIGRLAEAASCEPGSGRGGSGHTIPGSRPPIRLDGVDPALTLVDTGAAERVPLLVVLESWERLIRELRGLVPYGPASAARAAMGAPAGAAWWNDTTATLTGVLGFLAGWADWCTTDPEFPIEDYVAELRACRLALARWDTDREPRATVVPCPTRTIDGDCPGRLRLDGPLRCRHCGHEWDEETLVRAATSDPDLPDVWVDIDTAADQAGVSIRTVHRWASSGLVRRRWSTVAWRDIAAIRATRDERGA